MLNEEDTQELDTVKEPIKAKPVLITDRDAVLRLLQSEGMIITTQDNITDASIIAAQHKVIQTLVEGRDSNFRSRMEIDTKLKCFYKEALRNGFVIQQYPEGGLGAIKLVKAV
jgi:hypothetical protein